MPPDTTHALSVIIPVHNGGAHLPRCLDALRDCISNLEGRAQEVINLHYRDKAGRDAIATQLGMQPDGVKTLLRRIRQVLRECIERKVKAD